MAQTGTYMSGLFNNSGYLAHFNDNRNNIKVKYVVIDMTQKEKHPLNVSRFYNAKVKEK